MAYYKDVTRDEGEEPVVLRTTLAALDKRFLKPDIPSIEEPITLALGKSEEQVWEEREASGKTWRDSLEVVHSVAYRGTVGSEALRVPVSSPATPLPR